MNVHIDPIKLEVYKHRFTAIAEEMGAILQKTSYSPNIKERRDFSCAIFNARGKMIAQAAHIPVHLGSMPLSVKAALAENKGCIQPGDMIMLNDPFQGGTHLPDITLVTPVFHQDIYTEKNNGELFGFVASRAHHADVGGITPGSMPIAREIYQEGLIIPPIKIFEAGILNQETLKLILANVRTPEERSGDIWAQIAANHRGEKRLKELVSEGTVDEVNRYMTEMLAYTEQMTRKLIKNLPDGEYTFMDCMDNDGVSNHPVPIKVRISIQGERAQVDFTGSAPQQRGSINAVYAITLSAVYYVFRCLLGIDVPNNEGCLTPIEIIAPERTVVNAQHPAPVAGGNVETSQRIVDVLLGALAKAAPDIIPAASQGTMNNVTIGSSGQPKSEWDAFAYYETIGGGAGALPYKDGLSGIHTHMTNTLNTPIEALEYAYPLRVLRYEIRENSGGAGQYRGGEGIRRDVEVLVESQVTILSDRREIGPYGLNGGQPGAVGENSIIRDGETIKIAGKGSYDLFPGDILSIRTPGGGGYGDSME